LTKKSSIIRGSIQIDQSVAELIEKNQIYGRFAKAKLLSPYDRKKREKDRARKKVTYDLPTDIKDEINRIAKIESVPASQIAQLLLVTGINLWKKKQIPILKKSSKQSPLFDWMLVLPKIQPEEDAGHNLQQ
jgi:hypothetical protein